MCARWDVPIGALASDPFVSFLLQRKTPASRAVFRICMVGRRTLAYRLTRDHALRLTSESGKARVRPSDEPKDSARVFALRAMS